MVDLLFGSAQRSMFRCTATLQSPGSRHVLRGDNGIHQLLPLAEQENTRLIFVRLKDMSYPSSPVTHISGSWAVSNIAIIYGPRSLDLDNREPAILAA